MATIGPVSRRFRIVRTSSPVASTQSSPGITLRDEVDELAQFLAAWQRVTVDRLSGRVEQSEVLDKGLLAHVAKLLGAERIVISLLDPSGLRIVDGHPDIEESVVMGDSPSRRAVHSGQIFIGDLAAESGVRTRVTYRDETGHRPGDGHPDGQWRREHRRGHGAPQCGRDPVHIAPSPTGRESLSRRSPARSGSAASPINCAATISPPTMERTRLSNSLRMLLESAGEGIYGIDADGRCTFMNTAAAGALGVDVSSVMGELTHPLFHHNRADGSVIAFIDSPSTKRCTAAEAAVSRPR